MGKSGGRKKKAIVNPNQSQNKVSKGDSHATPVVSGVNMDSSVFSKRAHELKEEGNRRFQSNDYLGALEQYEDALKLTPKTNPDRAIFHSNRAACLMHIKPIDYGSVISECTLALQVQPQFVRALLRRARAYEAIGKYELAMLDVLKLLSTDSDNHDGLEIAGRLRMALGPHQEVQQELQSRPSPAALGASALRGAPISGVGPCSPARPMPKKPMQSVLGPTLPANKSEKLYPIPPIENGREPKIQLPKVVLKPPNSSRPNENSGLDNQKRQSVPPLDFLTPSEQPAQSAIRWRQLKLVYDHDIRLGQIPVNCSLKVLRDVVNKRFPMSKAVLIKYKDNDGDLVTITCTSELKMAESYVDSLIPRDPDADNRGGSIGMLRLYIVEVSPEQEPPLLEGGGEMSLDSKGATLDENLDASKLKTVDAEADNQEKPGAPEELDCKEMEVDDWLFEFAQLFRTHVGIDPDAHVDLHELGMELCSEALEETLTGEESQDLFDMAALKFQEVAALAFFNWGNVHMSEARKRIPIDESAAKEMMAAQLQTAYDWVKEKYSLAKEKYEEALLIKSDFYEGLLALGQQQFEMAKLHWSYVLAKKEDLAKWDPTETISLFNSAEQKMLAATEMWDKLEEQRANELKDPIANKKDELLKRRKKQSGTEGDSSGIGGRGEISPEEAAEQAALMRSQMHLFWGNMLFERSQVEYKLGFPGWKKNLNVAVERFKLAGASEADISAVLKNHCSNEEAANGNDKKQGAFVGRYAELLDSIMMILDHRKELLPNELVISGRDCSSDLSQVGSAFNGLEDFKSWLLGLELKASIEPHIVFEYKFRVGNLAAPVREWTVDGTALTSLVDVERRHGKFKPVIKKAMVELEGGPFKKFASLREEWALQNRYLSPGQSHPAAGTWGSKHKCEYPVSKLDTISS